MKHVSIIVRAAWDDEAKVWVATRHDIDGLAVEADRMERLEPRILGAISDLLELNDMSSDVREIPVHIMSKHLTRVSNPHFRAHMSGYLCDLKDLPTKAGCHSVRPGKGDHWIWFSPVSQRHFTVDHGAKSRHTANETFKQAGLPKAF